MTLEEMKARKRELGYSNEQLSHLSGVPLGTIIKIFGGATSAPRRATIIALEKILQPKTTYNLQEPLPGIVRDPAATYDAKEKPFTLEDYYLLPENARGELIDGVIYDMSAPTWNHQAIITEITMQLYTCQKAHNSPCRVAMAPVDVQLDKDQYTILQPDILVLCDLQKIQNGICVGVSMFCCFCSGLMVGNMKMIIARFAPWFNKINPAALITDSLYYLNIDSDYSRWSRAMITMTVMTVVLILLGFIISRRKKYASL